MYKSAGLYIHIPFCNGKCAYCDFYSCVPSGSLLDDYVSALGSELKKWGGRFDRPIDSVYFGGGTPSLLGEKIETLSEIIHSAFNITDGAEITAEINPEASDEFLKSAKNAGINRISMGVQSGNDGELETLGRRHTAYRAAKAYEKLFDTGFDNISLDLMLCLPGSGIKTLENSIDFFLSMNPQHISAYMLKIEENTKFGRIENLLLPDEDSCADQYLYCCERLESAGYLHYEISNFAYLGRESRHNLKYWRLCDYLGVGPAAHSMVDGVRFYYKRDLKKFISSPQTVFEGKCEENRERIMLGLRLCEGISLKELGINNKNVLLEADRLKKAGLANFNGDRFSLTDRGMLVSNAVINDITELAYENL